MCSRILRTLIWSKHFSMAVSVSTCNNLHTCIFNLLWKRFLSLLFILSLLLSCIPCIDLSLLHQFLKSPPSMREEGRRGGGHAASPHILNTCGKPCPVTHVFIEKILLHRLQSLSRFCNSSLLKQTIFNPMLFWDTPKYAENPQEYLQTVRWVQ